MALNYLSTHKLMLVKRNKLGINLFPSFILLSEASRLVNVNTPKQLNWMRIIFTFTFLTFMYLGAYVSLLVYVCLTCVHLLVCMYTTCTQVPTCLYVYHVLTYQRKPWRCMRFLWVKLWMLEYEPEASVPNCLSSHSWSESWDKTEWWIQLSSWAIGLMIPSSMVRNVDSD